MHVGYGFILASDNMIFNTFISFSELKSYLDGHLYPVPVFVKMSYKVEHDSVLREIFQDWNKQAHNVHLVSKEGHRIFSHRTQESSFLL